MSGDVQPRKRKDKKRKKDELSLEEHRGTAAAFGEGDVQMHSQHDHGTGGHWCARIIFFSLLAVLVTLIGLIILENRGLSELEAKAVETQYSGILDGWIEDTPEDDHHDEHTLDLKHHEHNEDVDEPGSENEQEFGDEDDDEDNDEDEHEPEFDEVDDDGSDNEDEDAEEDENDENINENLSKEIGDDDDNDSNDDDDNEETLEGEVDHEEENDNDSNEEEDDEVEEYRYNKPEDDDDDDDDENDDDHDNRIQGVEAEETADDNYSREDTGVDDDFSREIANNDDDRDNTQSVENADNEEDHSMEEQDDEDDEEHEEDEEEAEEEIEKIEKEVSDQDESESTELPVPDDSVEKEEETSVEAVNPDEEYEVEDKAFLEVDDLDEPAVERIAPPPPGKPYVEIEEEVSAEVAPDTLAEEEEYEKQQEELRQREAQSTDMWLKLAVGGALLAATHAVIRRVTAPRDTPESEQDEHASREETPLTDRRMTLLPQETPNIIPPQSIRPKVEEEIVQKVSSAVKAAAVQKQESEEVDEDVDEEDLGAEAKKTDDRKLELYSDEDENVADEEELEEKKEPPKSILKVPSAKKEPEPEEVADDVEIIDDEQTEEEVEEEVEDEEEISDVDDEELLSRLEAKYGRLPEPERPGQRHKDGGNSFEDEWPGEPSDPYWREQLEKAEQELRQGAYDACEARAGAARLASSARARWLRARALDQLAEARRDNGVLTRAIAAYNRLLEMNERLSDEKLLEVALRTIDRIQFRGTYLNAEPIYRLLIRRFPNDVTYRNNLTISFLMANRADLASEVLKETLRLWPKDRVALAHYGFVLKTEQNKLEEAVTYFQKALEGDAGPANEPRFYYHLGDALLMLGRQDEAHEVHERGAALGHFLSPSQRSLYNVPRLKSQPWWDVKTTPYANLARELEKSWREILKEGEAAQTLYEKEKEGLRERGEWSQLDLFVRGREVPGRCARAPVTCRIVKTEPAAQCRRGQVKFSLMSGGSHVRAHVGPTNCRLRMHLALSNTDNTYLRVDQEVRQWQVGKVLMFDDSFEHEVWHNGTGARLVLIVDVWHPALTPRERLALPAL